MSKTITKSSQLIKDFAGYTTLHGFHFVLGLYAPIRRLIWLCLILSCVSFLVIQLISSFEKLSAHRHVLDRVVVPSDNLTFPAFTLCNINMMKRSKINGTDAELFLDKFDPYMANQVKNRTLPDSFDLEKAVLKYGHTAEDTIKFCTWKGKDCSYKNFTTFFSYVYGLCHTFNLGNNGEQLLQSTSNHKDLGLMLIIDIDNTEYYGILSYLSTGIKVVVHDQKEHPMVEELGNDVMPGFTTTIKIKHKRFQRLPPPYRSACGSKKLVTSKVYTQSTCRMECNTRAVIQKQGCRLLGMPNLPEFNATGYCNPGDVSGDSPLDVLAIPRAKDCDCPLPCRETKYSTVSSLAYFPSQTFVERFTNSPTIAMAATSIIRARFLIVTAYFEELSTEVNIEKARYDFSDFGSDVGGNLGLFLGCSVLTIMEFIDLLIVYCREKYRVRNRTNQNDDRDIEAS